MGSVSTTQSGDSAYNYWEKGNTLTKSPVYDSSGQTQNSGNATLTMDFPMRELFLSNDGNGNLTIQVIGNASLNLNFLLLPGETFNERLPLFTSLIITTSGAWRYYVRSGRVA